MIAQFAATVFIAALAVLVLDMLLIMSFDLDDDLTWRGTLAMVVIAFSVVIAVLSAAATLVAIVWGI